MPPPKAEVWQADFSGSRGHEQKKDRPCVIWRDLDHVGLAIVIPFTSSPERAKAAHTWVIGPTAANGLEKESVALVFQITSLDKTRLIKKLGVLDEKDVLDVGAILKDMLRL